MRLSKKGLDLIKSFEGYHQKQQDGSCKSYLCPAGVYTIGYGCTVGVGPLTHWTEQEATEAFANELKVHEKAIEKLVRVPLTQGQFDALVSLCYNIGAEALRKSSLMKHLNAGDYARAASHFSDFKYSRVRGDTAKLYKVADGTRVALAGLVTRRAAETTLFLEAAPVEPMPQKIEAPTTKMKPLEAMGKVGAPLALAGAGATTAAPLIPEVPGILTATAQNAHAWKGLAAQLGSLPAEFQALGVGGGVALAVGFAVKKWKGA